MVRNSATDQSQRIETATDAAGSQRGGWTTWRSRTPLLLKKAALTFCALSLLLVCLEISTRMLTDITPPLFLNDPILGKTYRPGFEGRVFNSESGKYIDMRFSRDGLRGPDLPHKKTAGVRRIAILGDSFTAAMAVPEEDTAARILQALIAESHPGEKWEVMNCGISGSSTGQELVLYKEVVRNYQPDTVICAFCLVNDFGDNCRNVTSSPHRIYFDVDERQQLFKLPHSASRSKLSAWLNANSRFYVWQKQATSMLKHRAVQEVGVMSGYQLIYCQEPTKELEHAWLITEKLIESFKQEVEQDGGQFVLALFPASEQVYDERWQEILDVAGETAAQLAVDYPQQRLQQFCDRMGVPLVDMTGAFRQAAPNRSRAHEEQWLHFGGHGHFNKAGNRLAAEQIHQFMLQNELVISQHPSNSFPR